MVKVTVRFDEKHTMRDRKSRSQLLCSILPRLDRISLKFDPWTMPCTHQPDVRASYDHHILESSLHDAVRVSRSKGDVKTVSEVCDETHDQDERQANGPHPSV
jgi:hypothetical protein